MENSIKKNAMTKKSNVGLANLNQEQVALIKNTVAKGATDDELKLFIAVANRSGLDPFTRQVHFIKRRSWNKEKKQYDEIGSISTGIDGYRAVAARTGEHAGTDDAVIEEKDNLPIKASVTVYRMIGGEKRAFTATARFSEYVQQYKDAKTGKMEISGLWAKMPFLMISKIAEALALRKAFPLVLSGLYTEDEIASIPVEDGPKRVKAEVVNPVIEVKAEVVSETPTINSKKNRIMLLMKQAGLDPTENTADGWKHAVKSAFDMELEEANFDRIIEALETTLQAPPETSETLIADAE